MVVVVWFSLVTVMADPSLGHEGPLPSLGPREQATPPRGRALAGVALRPPRRRGARGREEVLAPCATLVPTGVWKSCPCPPRPCIFDGVRG